MKRKNYFFIIMMAAITGVVSVVSFLISKIVRD